MHHRAVAILALALAAACAGCERDTEPAPAEPAESPVPSAPASEPAATPSEDPAQADATDLGAITIDAPGDWTSEPPTNQLRVAQFVIPGDAGEASLIVYYFGPSGAGSVQANIDRWTAQFRPPDIDDPDAQHEPVVGETTVNDMPVTTVRLTGRFVAESMPGSGVRRDEPGWALLGAIVETPAGPYYFKAVGPEPTLDDARDDFDALIASVQPE